VTNVKQGDKVILHPLITCGLCRACRFGDDVHCEASKFPGIDSDGGYAEYLKTTARSVIKLDDSLEPADVAALADAGLTAYHAVAKASKLLRPGNFCVMIGAGGLGHIGIQVAKAISAATLIVIDRNPEALKLAKELGADHVIQGGEHGKFVKEVLDLTNGKGAEAVIDFVAEGGSTATGYQMVRRAGNYYVVGYGENVNIPTIDLISTVSAVIRVRKRLLTVRRKPTSSAIWVSSVVSLTCMSDTDIFHSRQLQRLERKNRQIYCNAQD